MKRVWIITIICLALLLSILFTARAGAEGVSMEAEVGYGGTYLLNSWTPVRVTLRNAGNDLEGTLEVSANIADQQRIIYSTPVNLPKDSEKEYTIYVIVPDAANSFSINLTNGSGKIVQSLNVKDLRSIGENNYLLGLVTDDQPSLGYWRVEMAGNQLFNYEPISLNAANFPERREELSAFSVLIFNNINTGEFRPEQLNALKNWLEDGGVLIAGTGVNGKRTISGLSDGILAIGAGELKALESNQVLEEYAGKGIESAIPLQVMDLRIENSRQLLGNAEAGLVWSVQRGRGTVFAAAFDLGTEPFLSWSGNRLLWARLLYDNLSDNALEKLRYPYEYKYRTSSYNLADVLGNIDAMKMPSAFLIMFLFLLYLALAGPVNYIFLKRIDKREWSWMTIPVLSILFAVLIFSMGYNTKGGELISNTISVVNLDANEKHGDLTNHIGIFIPRRGDYKVSIDRYALLTPLDGADYSGIADTPHARIVQGNPSEIMYENVNIWSMRTFKTDTRQVEIGSINTDLYYETGKIKGKIHNNTPYPLEHLVIYTNTAFVDLGNLAAGESKNVEMSLPVSGGSWHNDVYTMIDSVFPWPSVITYGNTEIRRDMTRRNILQSLLSPVYTKPGYQYGTGSGDKANSGVQRMEISYFAFYEGNPETGLLVNGRQPDRIMGDGIIMGSMDLILENDGFIAIPPGMLTSKFEEELSRAADYSDERFFIHDPNGYAVFSVDLAPYLSLKDLKAEIGVNILYGNGKVYVLSSDTGDYMELQDNKVQIDESNISQYAGADGKVYIKVQPGPDEYIEAIPPVVTLEGRKQ